MHTAVDSIVMSEVESTNLSKVALLLHPLAALDPSQTMDQRVLGINYHFSKPFDLLFRSVYDMIHFSQA